MTYAELRQRLNNLTGDQLADCNVTIQVGEEYFAMSDFHIQAIDSSDADIIEAGTPILRVKV